MNILTRRFKFNETVLSDPDPNMPPSEVLNFYSAQYPQLTTAAIGSVKEDLDNNVLEYEVKTQYDTKG